MQYTVKSLLFENQDERWLTTAQLADRLQVSPGTVRNWLSGRRGFSDETSILAGGRRLFRETKVIAFFNRAKRRGNRGDQEK